MELMSKGQTNQSEIARFLQIDRSTVCRDISSLRQQTKHNIRTYIDERLPFEYELCQVGINKILQKAWDIIHNDNDNKNSSYSEKAVLQALSLAKECYAMKQGLLADKTIIDRAVEFVQLKQLEVEEEGNVFSRRVLEEYNRGNAVF